MAARRPSQVFIVKLRVAPRVDAIRVLRAALKVLGRRFGLRAVSVEAEAEQESGIAS